MLYCKNCGAELPEKAVYCPRCGAPVAAEAVTAIPSTAASTSQEVSGFHLALWGERFVAWLIDVIILGIVVGILGIFAWFSSASLVWWSGWPRWFPFFNFGGSGIVYFLYWLIMDGVYGQSLGKMVMHLRVARLDGTHVNMVQAAIESVGKAFILPLDLILGWIFYPRKKQRLFNYISETTVIRE
jgi:uncharacterized RDD family membrane protein YckC